MPTPIWRFPNGNADSQTTNAFYELLDAGEFGPGGKHKVIFDHPDLGRIVFRGEFVAFNGAVISGIVEGLSFVKGAKSLDVTRLNVDFEALEDAIASYDGLFDMALRELFDPRKIMIGSGEDNSLEGSTEAGKLIGRGGDDYLYGRDGNETVKGGNGADIVYGGEGVDKLSGGKGRDLFVFLDDTLPEVDVVRDFSTHDDRIALDKHAFDALADGRLVKSAFHIGEAAETTEQHVIYDKQSGALFYDEDGAGNADQIRIATLSNHLKLGAKDFVVGDFI